MNSRSIVENGINADLFLPDSGQSGKTIIMLGGSEGGKSWSRVRQVLSWLTGRGYNVLSAAYFKAPGLPQTLQDIPLEMCPKLFDLFDDQAGKFAVLGGSKGAELALLLGSRFDQIKAVVAISPSSVVWQGIPESRFKLSFDVHSSWSWRGEGLPYVSYPLNGSEKLALLTLRLREMHEHGLRNLEPSSEAFIPVENIQGGVLLVSGEKDRMWPAAEMGDQVISRLSDHKFGFPYKHLRFATGHNGLVISRQVWREVFEFLDENLL